MKFGCGVSIFAFIFVVIHLQDSEAALCPYGSVEYIQGSIQITPGRKECKTCAAYICSKGISGFGCLKDFMSDCRNDQSVTEFFKSKYFNDIEFIGYGVTYVSGCGGEKDGGKCLVEKITQLIDEHGSDDDVYWSANGL